MDLPRQIATGKHFARIFPHYIRTPEDADPSLAY
jgi:hypothetical protein